MNTALVNVNGPSRALTAAGIDWIADMHRSKGLSMTATPSAVSSSVHQKGIGDRYTETFADSQEQAIDTRKPLLVFT